MGARKRKSDVLDSAPAAGPSSTKRTRTDSNVEKRLARFKVACPKDIADRVHRVMTQRFFMIERSKTEGELKEEFKVLGSTGNVYTVVISKVPSCDCPDATKGNHCKHILFVLLKVLSVPLTSTYYYQKALLASELENIFTSAPAAPNAVSNAHIQAAYTRAVGRPDEAERLDSKAEEAKDQRRMPEEGDDCPVCYESMHDVDIKTLTFCEKCGNALHMECFQQWSKKAHLPTCVWCRAKWVVGTNTAGGSGGNAAQGVAAMKGYINLAGVAGVSPVRDTSSYYGGRCGQRGHRYY